MSEGPVTKKRARKPKKVEEPEAMVINNKFVCAYTGMLIDKALFFKNVPGLAFTNFPCALSYVRARGKMNEKVATEMAAEYNQVVNAIPYAPDAQPLCDGKLDYDTWIGADRIWDALTESSGITVAQYRAGRGAASEAKKKKEAPTLEPAAYALSGHTCKKIDCNERPVDDEGKPTGKGKTIVSALRAVITHAKKEEGGLQHVDIFINDDGAFIGQLHKGGEVPVNAVAKSLCATDFAGPVLAILTRKTKMNK